MKYLTSLGGIGVLTLQIANRGLKTLNALPESPHPESDKARIWIQLYPAILAPPISDACVHLCCPFHPMLTWTTQALLFLFYRWKLSDFSHVQLSMWLGWWRPLQRLFVFKAAVGMLELACCGPWGLIVKSGGILWAGRHHISSLKLAMMGVFTPEKSANTMD